jgi:hypothetical protein
MLTDSLLENANQSNNILAQNIKVMCYICAIIVAAMIWVYSVSS